MVSVGELRAAVGEPSAARPKWKRSGHWERRLQWALWIIPVVVVVAMAWRLRWMSDDGFIHLRVVQQVVEGNGPVFNVGERVEASTSPLWVALLAVVYPVTGLALPWKAVLLGIAFTAVGLGAAQRAATLLAPRSAATADGSDGADGAGGTGRTDGDDGPSGADRTEGADGADGAATAGSRAGTAGRRLLVPVGAFVVAALQPFWEFATSGLETGFAFGWIGASSWWCARRVTRAEPPPGRVEAAGAVLVSLGWLIRPDFLIFGAAFGGVLLVTVWPLGWRRRLLVAGAGAALPVAYQLFRMGFYAMAVPNTALAKKASTAQWDQGWQYLGDLVSPYWLWLPLAVLLGLVATQAARDIRDGRRGVALARLAPALAGVAHALYIVRLGGDFMHARLLLPSVFGVVAPVGVSVPLEAGRTAVRRALVPAAVLLWVAVCAALLRPDYHYRMLGAEWNMSSDGTIAHERSTVVQQWDGGDLVQLDRRWDQMSRSRPDLVPRDGMLTLEWVRDDSPAWPLRPGLTADSARAVAAIGLVSYTWGPDVHVVDTYSLAHPIGSHIDHMVGDRPGHQKPVPPPWQVAALTDLRVVRTSDGFIVANARNLRAARNAIECGALARYLADISEPLTPSRFLGNITHSLGNSSFRLSPDPRRAEDALCG